MTQPPAITKMKSRLLILACAAAAAITCNAQRTTKLTASKANDFGVAYTLPRTVLDITIEAEITERAPGEFSNFANLYLNADNAVLEPSYTAKVKSITVVPRGVADENNRWMIEFKGTGVTYVMLDDAGVPLTINSEEIANIPEISLPSPTKAAPTALETPEAQYAVTQEMSASTSLSKRAQLASQRIFDLRETRSDLISGNADNTPPDGKSMQLMLDNLAAQEAALTAMFIGTEKTWTDVKTITYEPDGENTDKNLIIARISPVNGIVDASDLSGAPVMLSTDILTTGELPADEAGEAKKAPKDGVAYTIPGSIQLSISYAGSQILSKEYEIAQAGKTFFLDPKIFTDKKKPAFVTFNPVTGGLKEIGTITPKE